MCEVVEDGWMYPVHLAVSEEFPVSARGKWGSRAVGGMELDAAGDYLPRLLHETRPHSMLS